MSATRKRPTRAEWLGSRGERPRLMSTDDVAASFGVTRQRVGQIRREQPSFPRRQIELDGGPLWIRAGIEVWSGLHRPSALPEGSVLAPHGVRLLASAESVAASLGLSYVGVSQLWLALISDDPAVRKAFASLGASETIIRRFTRRHEPPADEPPPAAAMNSRVQALFEAGAARAHERGAAAMVPLDLAIAMIDAGAKNSRGRPDLVLGVLESRGLDVDELRRRLVSLQEDPGAASDFDPRALKRLPRRVDRLRRLLGDLAPNGLGHDPWTRRPWGTGFAVRKDGRSLKVDGEQWFFFVDRDGYYVRTVDGRPTGYRWRIQPTPAEEPVNGPAEVLPMPPSDVGYWPDYRHPRG